MNKLPLGLRYKKDKGRGFAAGYVQYDGKTDDLEITRRIARDGYDSGLKDSIQFGRFLIPAL